MNVKELRKLLLKVENQNAVVRMHGESIEGLQTAFGGGLVRLLGTDVGSSIIKSDVPPLSSVKGSPWGNQVPGVEENDGKEV
jgi:hypothetical protein